MASVATWVPIGHLEGFIEAFGNIYCAFINLIEAGTDASLATPCGIGESARSMALVEAAIASSAVGSVWRAILPHDETHCSVARW